MRIKFFKILIYIGSIGGFYQSVLAEDEPFNLAKTVGLSDSFAIDGALRSRYEFTDWYSAGKDWIDNKDSFSSIKSQLGILYKQESFKFYLQGQYDQVFDLSQSTDAGISPLYRNFNEGESNPGSVYFRQAYAQFPSIAGSGLTLLGGRFLYSSGAEVSSDHDTLKWLKKLRISERMIGPFDYTFGRSFDGSRMDYSIKDLGTLTMTAFHPTQGGFKTDGMETITDITVLTSAFTHQYKLDNENQGEVQLFYYRYDDDRNVVKTDNRSLDIRQSEINGLAINNYGAHLVHTSQIGTGIWDGIIWGVLQEGNWGQDHHVAQAFAAETGYKFDNLYGKPWIRTGLNLGSGDSDSTDSKHGTFFEMLPTSRIYAMTPFYNMMNMQDFFVQGIWKPLDKVTLRTDVHVLNVVSAKDLLYAGAGANSRNGPFGYAGTSTGGESSVGTLIDGSLGFELNKHVGINLYYGYLIPGDVMKNNFTKKDDITYGFMELNFKL